MLPPPCAHCDLFGPMSGRQKGQQAHPSISLLGLPTSMMTSPGCPAGPREMTQPTHHVEETPCPLWSDPTPLKLLVVQQGHTHCGSQTDREENDDRLEALLWRGCLSTRLCPPTLNTPLCHCRHVARNPTNRNAGLRGTVQGQPREAEAEQELSKKTGDISTEALLTAKAGTASKGVDLDRGDEPTLRREEVGESRNQQSSLGMRTTRPAGLD